MKIKQKTNSQKTPGFKNQMRIGASIADALPQMFSVQDTANALGLSATMVRRIECQALYKLRARMVAIREEIL